MFTDNHYDSMLLDKIQSADLSYGDTTTKAFLNYLTLY